MDLSSTTTASCSTPEPWGRYSASGGLYSVNRTNYLYGFGGDTGSDADDRGGVVRTHFRFNLETRCWERLGNSVASIGYRSTATRVEDDPDGVYVLFGAGLDRAATGQMHRYSLSNDAWTELETTGSASAIPGPRWKHAAVALGSSRILVTGGRDGATVRDDAWVLDTKDSSWTRLNATGLPAVYRHGMAFDPLRNVAWIYGGLDGSLDRYRSQLWRFDLTDLRVTEMKVDTTTTNPPPPRLASHAMEYVQELDVLLLWGGTCGDDSELHVYDIANNSWCRIFPANRPDRRDAHLWAMQYPRFYVAQGDIICYNRQVLTIADVHVLNLQSLDTWENLYEPTNTPRGTGTEPYCDGSNAGNCQPTPFLADTGATNSTCSADLLDRFFQGGASTAMPNSTLGPTTSELAPAPTTTFSPTTATLATATSKSSDPAKPAENSRAGSDSLPLLWVVLVVAKLLLWR